MNFFIINNYKKEVNIKIQGSGVGGCDIILQPGETEDSECWCLWGTVNYGFCAYTASPFGDDNKLISHANITSSTVSDNLKSGRCDVVTGESLTCSDVTSLGNCYDGAYECEIDHEGLCHCHTV